MLGFSNEQLVIAGLIFTLGFVFGAMLFSGGGRKWRARFDAEKTAHDDLKKRHAEAEKEWRERDALRAAALKNPAS